MPIISALLGLAIIVYIVKTLMPPANPIGKSLSGWDSVERKQLMVKHETQERTCE